MSIEENLGYQFSDKQLLERALTRKAYANEQKQQNKDCKDQEIFRTLGDAVLKTVLVDLLIQKGLNTREEITNRKMELESEEGLSKKSRELNVGAHILIGLGEKKQKANEKQYVLSETLEAIIGAIYLDGGFDEAKKVVSALFRSEIEDS